MHPIDLAIIFAYLALMSLVGWWVAKKASRNAESYFLAGKSLPWWIIGVAHGSSGVDITGTMWFVMMFFIYGVKGIWLLWVWPLFSVIFRMVYLGTWVRRSNVLTGAEWMRTRFGYSRGAELAYLSVVVYALVHVVGFLCYAFRGIAEFTKPFFPWDLPYEFYGTAMLLVTGIYCVVGGMYSVVMNDLIQFVLKLVAAIGIAVIAIIYIQPEQIMAAVPAGWDQMFFGWKLNLDWSNLIPALQHRVISPPSDGGDGYSLFFFFTAMLFFKGVLVSLAGPTPNYAIQHVLSTRSPREAALENMLTHYPGGYQYYLDKTNATSGRAGLTAGNQSSSAQPATAKAASAPSLSASRKEQKRLEAQERQTRSRERKAQQALVTKLETEIHQLEARQKELVAALESPETYDKTGRAVQINRELLAIQDRLAELTPQWEQEASQLEGLQGQ